MSTEAASHVELMSDQSLRQLQGRLDINAMSSKIDRSSAIVAQAFAVASAQPCKRKRTTQLTKTHNKAYRRQA